MATARVGTLRLKQHRDLARHPGEKPDDDFATISLQEEGIYDNTAFY
jgi:hypothetical protein